MILLVWSHVNYNCVALDWLNMNLLVLLYFSKFTGICIVFAVFCVTLTVYIHVKLFPYDQEFGFQGCLFVCTNLFIPFLHLIDFSIIIYI